MSRSVRIHEFGGPEVLKIEEISIPNPGEGQVRIRVRSIGLNRTEVTFRSGRSLVRPAFPTQIGWEAAGEIESVGADVEGFAPGDRISVIPAYGVTEYGLYGDVSLAPARALVKIPEGQSFNEAAATWAAFGTAWCGLIDLAGLKAGDVVLLSAASSSVGLAAIQTARRVGAVPIALTRTRVKSAALRQAGAAHVIATQEQDVVEEVLKLTSGKGADVVFDAVGGASFPKLAEATAVGGLVVIYGALSGEATTLPTLHVLVRQLTIRGFGLPAATKNDAKLAALKRFVLDGLRSGALRPRIMRVFPFDEIAEAHRYLDGGAQIGKIVVTV